jgi:hypothetical protein
VTEFKEHYELFAKRNQTLFRVEDDVHAAIMKAAMNENIKRSAVLFGSEITTTINVLKRKQELSQSKWTGKLGNFLTKFYPVACLSLRLSSVIADVCPKTFSC